MVPTVEPDATQKDKRKGKKLQWREAKICLAHAQGSRTPTYGGTLQGDVAAAGRQLFHGAKAAGLGSNTQVHAVGMAHTGLPIGSGEIESAHRYIVQLRLKRPASWWRAAHADHMLALRLNRANHRWNDYWAHDLKLAA